MGFGSRFVPSPLLQGPPEVASPAATSEPPRFSDVDEPELVDLTAESLGRNSRGGGAQTPAQASVVRQMPGAADRNRNGGASQRSASTSFTEGEHPQLRPPVAVAKIQAHPVAQSRVDTAVVKAAGGGRASGDFSSGPSGASSSASSDDESSAAASPPPQVLAARVVTGTKPVAGFGVRSFSSDGTPGTTPDTSPQLRRALPSGGPSAGAVRSLGTPSGDSSSAGSVDDADNQANTAVVSTGGGAVEEFSGEFSSSSDSPQAPPRLPKSSAAPPRTAAHMVRLRGRGPHTDSSSNGQSSSEGGNGVRRNGGAVRSPPRPRAGAAHEDSDSSGESSSADSAAARKHAAPHCNGGAAWAARQGAVDVGSAAGAFDAIGTAGLNIRTIDSESDSGSDSD